MTSCEKCGFPISVANRENREWHKENCVTNDSLSLLIVDMGDSVVVKVEKGRLDGFWADKKCGILSIDNAPVFEGQTVVSDLPFTDLRSELDDASETDNKPVPRIEYSDTGEGWRYLLYHNCRNLPNPHRFAKFEYDALSQLAGKELPVYEGGKWEQILPVKDGIYVEFDVFGVEIWRYTR